MNTLISKNASPETLLAWQLMSALIAYTTITPLFYEGLVTGTEFLTYNVNKMYFALQFRASIVGAGIRCFSTYNMANVVKGLLLVDSQGSFTKGGDENIYFSRILQDSGAPYIMFVGYRLNV